MQHQGPPCCLLQNQSGKNTICLPFWHGLEKMKSASHCKIMQHDDSQSRPHWTGLKMLHSVKDPGLRQLETSLWSLVSLVSRNCWLKCTEETITLEMETHSRHPNVQNFYALQGGYQTQVQVSTAWKRDCLEQNKFPDIHHHINWCTEAELRHDPDMELRCLITTAMSFCDVPVWQLMNEIVIVSNKTLGAMRNHGLPRVHMWKFRRIKAQIVIYLTFLHHKRLEKPHLVSECKTMHHDEYPGRTWLNQGYIIGAYAFCESKQAQSHSHKLLSSTNTALGAMHKCRSIVTSHEEFSQN